jgi:hypothetical protein
MVCSDWDGHDVDDGDGGAAQVSQGGKVDARHRSGSTPLVANPKAREAAGSTKVDVPTSLLSTK